ncbi:MAG TPA: OsmC family protein [Chitinophagales bacterium]|nr:OsmC family protein [Chitinophagales bacterium]
MKRTSTASWNGSGKEGSGTITSQSKVLDHASYTWRTRFQDVEGTSPEELIAAAHAGCFTMKLSFVLGNAGFTPDSIETAATVSVHEGVINNSHLVVKAKVPGISAEKFQECAEDAKVNCPVSKALNTNITMEAALTS